MVSRDKLEDYLDSYVRVEELDRSSTEGYLKQIFNVASVKYIRVVMSNGQTMIPMKLIKTIKHVQPPLRVIKGGV